MWENGGPGVWAPDYREQYDLLDPEWRFDAIPQILDGKNIADYFDPDIEEKLRMLEEEEDRLQEGYSVLFVVHLASPHPLGWVLMQPDGSHGK